MDLKKSKNKQFTSLTRARAYLPREEEWEEGRQKLRKKGWKGEINGGKNEKRN